jgi:hypothetical protein
MKSLIAFLLVGFSALSQAAVAPVDINKDGKLTAFLDQQKNLLWTNGDLFAKNGLNYNNANSAINGLNTSSFEGISNWRLPTISEFTSLYNTQGNVAGKMNRDPFTIFSNFYWTSDQDRTNYKAFGFNEKDQITSFANYRSLNVWAVSPVPEPEAYVMLLSGLGMIGYAARRRRAKQI